ncbi:hypothetical protein ABPG73_022420 [Tetrahymena malaccensis]
MLFKDQSKETPLNLAVNYVLQKMKKEDEFLENGFISFQKLKNLQNEDNLEMELNFNSKIKQNQNYIELAKKEIKEKLSLRNSQLIGFGCQSYVFSSVDHNMKRFAVKCFNICKNNSEELDPEKLKKAEFEAEVLINNRNQNVVYCFKSVKGDNFYLIQLEQCVGTLTELKEQIGYLSEKQFMQYFIDLMKGLKFTQNNKMINRDLKPDNILIGFDGRLKLSDFGLSYQLKSFSTKYASSIEGNCYHFAPELMDENIKKMIQNLQQSFESKQSLKTDCFAAGLILLNLVCNHQDFNYYHLLHQEEYVKNMQFSFLDHFKLKDPIVQMLKSLLAFYPWQRADPEQILDQFENLMNQNPENSVLNSSYYLDPLNYQEYQKLQQIKCGNFIPVNEHTYYLLPFNYIYSLAQKKYYQSQVQQQYNQNQQNNSNQNQIYQIEQNLSKIQGQLVNFAQINQSYNQFNQKIENLTKLNDQNFQKLQQLEKQILSYMQKTNNQIEQIGFKFQQQTNQYSSQFVDAKTYSVDLKQVKQDFEIIKQQLNDSFLASSKETSDLKQQFYQQSQQIAYLHQQFQSGNIDNYQNNNQPNLYQEQNLNQQQIPPNIMTNQNAQQNESLQKMDSNKKHEKAVTIINQNQQNFNTKQQQQTYEAQNYNQFEQQQYSNQQQQQYNNKQNYNQNQMNQNEVNLNPQKEFYITHQQQLSQQIYNQNQANPLDQQKQFKLTPLQLQQQQTNNQNQINYNNNPYAQQQQQQFQKTQQQQQAQQFNNQSQKNSNEYIFNPTQVQNQNFYYQNPFNQQKQFQITQNQEQTQQIQNQNQQNCNQANQVKQNQFNLTKQDQTIQQNSNQNQEQLNKDAQIQQQMIFKKPQDQNYIKPLYKNYSHQQQFEKEDVPNQNLNKSQPLKIKEPDYFELLNEITLKVKKFFNSINQTMISQFTEETVLQSYNLNDTHIFLQGLQFPQNIITPSEKDGYYQKMAKNDDLPSNCKLIKVIKLFNKNYYIQFGSNKDFAKEEINKDQYNQFLSLFEQIKQIQQQQQKN